MSNVFVNLPVPPAPGVGASVAVSGIGPEKSLVVEGPGGTTVPTGTNGSLAIEVSEDGGAHFAPFLTVNLLGDPGVPSFTVVCSHMRVRRLAGFGGGSVTVTIGGESTTSNAFATVVVPGSGTGPGVDISTLGGQKTIVVSGIYDGNLAIEGSVNGGATYDPIVTCNTNSSDVYVTVGVWQFMRVRRIGGSLGSVSVAVGGHPLTSAAAAGVNTCIPKWGGKIYVPAGNGQVPNPYILYFSDSNYVSIDDPIYYVVPAAGVASLLRVTVMYNECNGDTTFTLLNGIVPTGQSVVVAGGLTGTFITAGPSAPCALNDLITLQSSVVDDFGSHTMYLSAMCLYTIS
jgi:hypothetical protein